MITISIGLGAVPVLQNSIGLIVSGLTMGAAQPGNLLEVSLSSGDNPTSYAWGSSLGAADYSTQATFLVPQDIPPERVYVSVELGPDIFETTISVTAVAPPQTAILTGPDAILVDSLRDLASPTLLVSPTPNAINVEIA